MVCYTLIGPSRDGIPPSDPGSAHAIFQRAVGGGYASDTAKLSFSADTPAGDAGASMPERLYAWASVIQGGRVVATDYAPDTGWLVPSETAKN